MSRNVGTIQERSEKLRESMEWLEAQDGLRCIECLCEAAVMRPVIEDDGTVARSHTGSQVFRCESCIEILETGAERRVSAKDDPRHKKLSPPNVQR